MSKKAVLTCSLAMLLALAPAVQAMTVYLKDGAVIDAKGVWRDRTTVYVMINKEDVVEFAPGEVNLHRTFGRQYRGHLVHRGQAGKEKGAVRGHQKVMRERLQGN